MHAYTHTKNTSHSMKPVEHNHFLSRDFPLPLAGRCRKLKRSDRTYTYAHTHTHAYIYIYTHTVSVSLFIYIYIYNFPPFWLDICLFFFLSSYLPYFLLLLELLSSPLFFFSEEFSSFYALLYLKGALQFTLSTPWRHYHGGRWPARSSWTLVPHQTRHSDRPATREKKKMKIGVNIQV